MSPATERTFPKIAAMIKINQPEIWPVFPKTPLQLQKGEQCEGNREDEGSDGGGTPACLDPSNPRDKSFPNPTEVKVRELKE